MFPPLHVDVEFWSCVAQFVERFSGVQKAIVADRKEKEEREVRV